MSQQHTILIADDDRDLLEVLTARCRQLTLFVVAVEDALTALSTADFAPPDLFCLDVDMPGGNGLAACEMIAGDERLSDIPVIILTGKQDDKTIRRCHELKAFYVQKGADIWCRLEPLICELLSMTPNGNSPPADVRPASPNTPTSVEFQDLDTILDALEDNDSPSCDESPSTAAKGDTWVLHIDDDAEMRDLMKMRLERHGVSVINAFDGTSGVRSALAKSASAIILDYQMPNGRGDYVLRRLKDNPITRNIPVVVLTGVRDKAVERRLLSMGAAAYLHKPLKFEQLLRELQKSVDIPETSLAIS